MTGKASSLQSNYHLAQIKHLPKMRASLNDPIMAEFANALEEVNTVAETKSWIYLAVADYIRKRYGSPSI